MRDLNIGSQIQPIFLNSDIPIIEKRIGLRSKEAYLFNTMFKLGIPTAFSTDSPVEPVNPFHNLYTAITRTSIKYPDYELFLESEGFTLEEALECYQNGYYHSYDEKEQDYIIVDRDIYNCSVEELRDT